MTQNVLAQTKLSTRWIANQKIWIALAVLVVLFLATFHLTGYPTTWFDEGSHLHVPKTLIRFGVYADYSSDGFRYYGPTVGVGPTVFLPIVLVFKLFGIGLLQARSVIVVYLLATILAFYRMARQFGKTGLALVATLLLITSRGIGLLQYGREVLGEVPGFFFMAAGLAVWFTALAKPTWLRMLGAGILLGLSMVTKNQYLLVLGPTMALAWIANMLYYRSTPNRAFLIPGIVAFGCFVLWNVYLLLYLGPATASQNLTMMRNATQGAALVFSPALMKRALSQLLSIDVFLGLLFPALAYGLYLSIPRNREGQQWGILFILALFNLVWYVFASISWLRYAFPALAVTSLFVARFFSDLTGGFHIDWSSLWRHLKTQQPSQQGSAASFVLLIWLAVMIVLPLGQTAKEIVSPAFNAPAAMAEYMNQNVPKDKIVETWEPEMSFLTDHNYHFPPSGLLNNAVGFIWLGKPSPAALYHYVQDNHPPYVLVGGFSTWVQLYPAEVLASNYHLVKAIGGYELYQLNP